MRDELNTSKFDTQILVRRVKEKKFDETKFGTKLNEYIIEKGFKISDVILYANMDKGYFYKILKGKRIPNRDAVIKLGILLGLTLEDVNLLLAKAGHNELISTVSKRDALLTICIGRKKSLHRTRQLLEEIGEDTLE